MLVILSSLLAVAGLHRPFASGPLCGSYLYQPAFCIDEVLRYPVEPYIPQPGDIMLRLDHSKFWRATHYLALAFDPNGSAIVFARPDGSPAILEAGPNDTMWVRTLDLVHLKDYGDIGRVWIRRRRVPLTPEQSCRLTEFALAQDGKRFALLRLGVQLTPFRSRGPLRTYFMGGPHGGDRRSYFCSELVSEACVEAGLLDPARTRPSATYPRDLFYGNSCNFFLKHHLDVNEGWFPPARWTDRP